MCIKSNNIHIYNLISSLKTITKSKMKVDMIFLCICAATVIFQHDHQGVVWGCKKWWINKKPFLRFFFFFTHFLMFILYLLIDSECMSKTHQNNLNCPTDILKHVQKQTSYSFNSWYKPWTRSSCFLVKNGGAQYLICVHRQHANAKLARNPE